MGINTLLPVLRLWQWVMTQRDREDNQKRLKLGMGNGATPRNTTIPVPGTMINYGYFITIMFNEEGISP